MQKNVEESGYILIGEIVGGVRNLVEYLLFARLAVQVRRAEFLGHSLEFK